MRWQRRLPRVRPDPQEAQTTRAPAHLFEARRYPRIPTSVTVAQRRRAVQVVMCLVSRAVSRAPSPRHAAERCGSADGP